MMYTKELVKVWVDEMMNVAKKSTETSCLIPYEDIKSFDPSDKVCQSDIREYICEDSILFDTINTIDFYRKRRLIIIMFYEAPMKENNIMEVKEMKKYTLKDYEAFTREALVCPPMEEFEDGSIDENKWYEDHKIRIAVGEHEIEIDYHADSVNEVDFALREMYEEEYGNGNPTTGNTVGSEYRAAELKDIIHVALQKAWDEYGWKTGNLSEFLEQFIGTDFLMSDAMNWYQIILEDIKNYTECYHCNFGKLNMYSMRNINARVVRDIVRSLIGTDRELLVGYDNDNKCSDITFVMDYTIKQSGDLIGWFYGDQDPQYINELVEDYKNKLLREEK